MVGETDIEAEAAAEAEGRRQAEARIETERDTDVTTVRATIEPTETGRADRLRPERDRVEKKERGRGSQ